MNSFHVMLFFIVCVVAMAYVSAAHDFDMERLLRNLAKPIRKAVLDSDDAMKVLDDVDDLTCRTGRKTGQGDKVASERPVAPAICSEAAERRGSGDDDLNTAGKRKG
ncbi:hypothetical protein MSG28_014261 [Choristoneura fumiferana]|uniref:Uncharacterized protein n=1 Tax=Choristoneura fumiferana TaxID=7141 RepID=A0ACC0JGL1_CHOFU|nr:hypothetical protein MSG28_014261 [Choristoneura fumiferana]